MTEDDEIREAARKVLQGFDDGVWVRNTKNDGASDWALRLLPYAAALGKLAHLLNYEPKGDGL